MSVLDWLFGSAGDLPAGQCMLWRPDLLSLYVAADVVVTLSAMAIPFGIAWYMQRRPGMPRPYRVLAWSFGAFVAACGAIQLLDAVALWHPIYGLEGLAKGAAAAISGATVALMWPLLPGLVRLPSSRQLAEVNARLRQEAESHEATLRDLDDARRELETRVEARTRELSQVTARLETALRGAKIYLFSQDRDLRYTWIYSPLGEAAAAGVEGRTDGEILPTPEHEAVIAVKRQVLATGKPRDCEVSCVLPEQRGLFALHVEPVVAPDCSVEGVQCVAIDISRIRSLESEQHRLTQELGTAVQRYETALRGSNVTVYTQDRALRYTSVSSPIFGREVGDIVGHLEEDIVPAEGRGPIVKLKRQVLESGASRNAELQFDDGSTVRWYDMHMEPLRDIAGVVVGLTCAAVDITASKAAAANLRDLMRELTHRSKNLLAVIQAMARQTARHATSIESFLDRFSERLQALADSHDLLLRDSWYGASLAELVRSQLGHHLDREDPQVTMDGPALLLKPEAAQSVGLALHELATNAAKYGALSVPGGHVTIRWRRFMPSHIEIEWSESGGPPVKEPKWRGFGSHLIEQNLARSLDADISLAFAPEGVRCRMAIPASNLAPGR